MARLAGMNGHIIADTPICVDYWLWAPHEKYFRFLSHLHADHTYNLKSTFRERIYTSPTNAGLLRRWFHIDAKQVVVLELNICHVIWDMDGNKSIRVTLLDANHCPGSVMFLFQGTFGNILYTGDFRYYPEILDNPQLKRIVESESLDQLYLDNTYAAEHCQFMTRDEAKKDIIKVIEEHPDHYVLIGVRKIGKEDVLRDIALHFKEKVLVSAQRMEVLKLLRYPNVFTVNSSEARIYAKEMHLINVRFIHSLMKEKGPVLTLLLSARQMNMQETKAAPSRLFQLKSMYVIPYSDHSTHAELYEFVSRVRPGTIHPIVRTEVDLEGFSEDVVPLACCNTVIPDSIMRLARLDVQHEQQDTDAEGGLKRKREESDCNKGVLADVNINKNVLDEHAADDTQVELDKPCKSSLLDYLSTPPKIAAIQQENLNDQKLLNIKETNDISTNTLLCDENLDEMLLDALDDTVMFTEKLRDDDSPERSTRKPFQFPFHEFTPVLQGRTSTKEKKLHHDNKSNNPEIFSDIENSDFPTVSRNIHNNKITFNPGVNNVGDYKQDKNHYSETLFDRLVTNFCSDQSKFTGGILSQCRENVNYESTINFDFTEPSTSFTNCLPSSYTNKKLKSVSREKDNDSEFGLTNEIIPRVSGLTELSTSCDNYLPSSYVKKKNKTVFSEEDDNTEFGFPLQRTISDLALCENHKDESTTSVPYSTKPTINAANCLPPSNVNKKKKTLLHTEDDNSEFGLPYQKNNFDVPSTGNCNTKFTITVPNSAKTSNSHTNVLPLSNVKKKKKILSSKQENGTKINYSSQKSTSHETLKEIHRKTCSISAPDMTQPSTSHTNDLPPNSFISKITTCDRGIQTSEDWSRPGIFKKQVGFTDLNFVGNRIQNCNNDNSTQNQNKIEEPYAALHTENDRLRRDIISKVFRNEDVVVNNRRKLICGDGSSTQNQNQIEEQYTALHTTNDRRRDIISKVFRNADLDVVKRRKRICDTDDNCTQTENKIEELSAALPSSSSGPSPGNFRRKIRKADSDINRRTQIQTKEKDKQQCEFQPSHVSTTRGSTKGFLTAAEQMALPEWRKRVFYKTSQGAPPKMTVTEKMHIWDEINWPAVFDHLADNNQYF